MELAEGGLLQDWSSPPAPTPHKKIALPIYKTLSVAAGEEEKVHDTDVVIPYVHAVSLCLFLSLSLLVSDQSSPCCSLQFPQEGVEV